MKKGDKFWNKYSWVIMGSQRREVIKFLPDKPVTAEEIRKKINDKTSLKLSLREMSRHLTSFVKQGFTICLNPNSPYNRLYLLTNEGKKIKEELLKTSIS
jgi:DNA-binding transcriptional ArsR family regulator